MGQGDCNRELLLRSVSAVEDRGLPEVLSAQHIVTRRPEMKKVIDKRMAAEMAASSLFS